jgi:transposase
MATVCVGIDLSSSTIAVCALEKVSGRTLYEKEFKTGEQTLCEAIRSIAGELTINIEVGELASWATQVLKRCANVKEIICSHAKSNKHIACDALKNDRVDARKLAEALRLGQVHAVTLAQDDRLEFKRLVQHYERITREEIRLKNMLKAQFRGQGIFDLGDAVYSPGHIGDFLKRVPSEFVRTAIHQQFELLQVTLKAQRDALKLLRKASKRYPEVQRLMTAPGIGVILATRFAAYIHTPERFQTRGRLWRFCRLGIMNQMSGGVSLSGQRLDFNGSPTLKDLSRQAFKAAVQQSREDNALKKLYHASLERTHNSVHARLNIQRKILTVLWTMWKKNEDYDDAKLLKNSKG